MATPAANMTASKLYDILQPRMTPLSKQGYKLAINWAAQSLELVKDEKVVNFITQEEIHKDWEAAAKKLLDLDQAAPTA